MTRNPKLRSDLVLVEQTYRGERSYIVKDPETYKYYRFGVLEAVVMQEFDGGRTPDQIAQALQGEGVPVSAAAVEKFAGRLHRMGLIERSLQERSVLQLERLRADRRRRLQPASYRGSLLRMRWSVGDPDQLLERWLPRLRFCFTPAFIAGSLVLFAVYVAVCLARWPEFAAAVERVYTPSQYTPGFILMFYTTGIGIIIIHELGHAFTCKYFGGRVHEMGAMLVYFEPAFYCNVNDAWTFPDLRSRMWVTVAGSWIQLVLAGLAAMVWWVAAPGTLVSQVALTAVLIGGVTTVFANANPLIPLDGYYALSDYLEVPNLRQRAFGYLTWTLKRRLLRLQVPEPPATPRERRIFLTYSLLAALYIGFLFYLIGAGVLGWVSRQLGVLGVIAFLLLVWAMTRQKLMAGVRAILTSVREHRHAWRAGFRYRWGLAGALALLVLALLPWPITVGGRFTVAPPLTLALVAGEQGTVAQVYAREGDRVAAGTVVARLANPTLEREAAEARRETDSLNLLAYRARAGSSAGTMRQLEAERDQASARLDGLRERMRHFDMRAAAAGIIATPRLEETLGEGLNPGDTLAILLADGPRQARVVLDHDAGSLARPGQAVRLLPLADPAARTTGMVAAVAAAGAEEGPGRVEVRITIPPDAGWHTGSTGEARLVLRRSTLAGAVWYALRSRIRGDLLL